MLDPFLLTSRDGCPTRSHRSARGLEAAAQHLVPTGPTGAVSSCFIRATTPSLKARGWSRAGSFCSERWTGFAAGSLRTMPHDGNRQHLKLRMSNTRVAWAAGNYARADATCKLGCSDDVKCNEDYMLWGGQPYAVIHGAGKLQGVMLLGAAWPSLSRSKRSGGETDICFLEFHARCMNRFTA